MTNLAALKVEALSSVTAAWKGACATGTQTTFGIWTRKTQVQIRQVSPCALWLMWRNLGTGESGVLVRTPDWRVLDAVALAVCIELKHLRNRQRMFAFPKPIVDERQQRSA